MRVLRVTAQFSSCILWSTHRHPSIGCLRPNGWQSAMGRGSRATWLSYRQADSIPGRDTAICSKRSAEMRDLPGWRCWIAGAPQRPEEETAIGKNSLGLTEVHFDSSQRVSFIGHQDDMETALAARGDVYCQPNETPEPFGMVFVEAMYAGKPVVGRALGGALEIVTPDHAASCAHQAQHH